MPKYSKEKLFEWGNFAIMYYIDDGKMVNASCFAD